MWPRWRNRWEAEDWCEISGAHRQVPPVFEVLQLDACCWLFATVGRWFAGISAPSWCLCESWMLLVANGVEQWDYFLCGGKFRFHPAFLLWHGWCFFVWIATAFAGVSSDLHRGAVDLMDCLWSGTLSQCPTPWSFQAVLCFVFSCANYVNVLSHLAFCFDYGIICLMFHTDSGVGFNDCKFHKFMLQTISKRAHHFMFLFKSTSQSFWLSCASTVFCFQFSWQCSGSPWWLKGSSFFSLDRYTTWMPRHIFFGIWVPSPS